MTFPVWIELPGPWGLRLHPHWLFETAAYFVGFRLYLAGRRRQGDQVADPTRWWLVVAAALGAAVGSRVLFLLLDPAHTWAHLGEPRTLLGGRTIVGAILGAWLTVEAAKLVLGVTSRTGDLFALPLTVAMAIGRLGCFLSGVEDHTAGLPTTLPWGLDQGDGVLRHPTALYELGFLLVLAAVLATGRLGGASLQRHRVGDTFRVFLIAYLSWRLLIDVLKPGLRFGGLTSIQWAAVAGLVVLLPDLVRMVGSRRVDSPVDPPSVGP